MSLMSFWPMQKLNENKYKQKAEEIERERNIKKKIIQLLLEGPKVAQKQVCLLFCFMSG